MNTDEFIEFVTTMNPADAPPEIIAKLYKAASDVSKFAKAINDCALALALANELPGFELRDGNKKALKWLGNGPYPETYYDKVLLSPTQVIKQNLATEKELVDKKQAMRPESEKVPVAMEDPEGAEVF